MAPSDSLSHVTQNKEKIVGGVQDTLQLKSHRAGCGYNVLQDNLENITYSHLL